MRRDAGPAGDEGRPGREDSNRAERADDARPRHIPEARLHDYVDGVLGRGEEQRLERHMAGCVSCRREADTLRALAADLAALPGEIPPARDLRPGIAARIAEGSEDGSTLGARQALRTLRWPLAAAALILVVGTAWLTAALAGGPRAPGETGPVAEGPAAEVAPEAALTAAGSLEAEYLPAIRQLAELLERRRSELSPETVRTLEENLRVIDRAIEESRRALAADPDDRVLREMLVGGYEAKVEFLQRAAALTVRG